MTDLLPNIERMRQVFAALLPGMPAPSMDSLLRWSQYDVHAVEAGIRRAAMKASSGQTPRDVYRFICAVARQEDEKGARR
jgi:hypothetical protein